MVTKPTRSEKKLLALECIRTEIEKKLDRSYLQNNVSELPTLESKYVTVIRRISRIKNLGLKTAK